MVGTAKLADRMALIGPSCTNPTKPLVSHGIISEFGNVKAVTRRTLGGASYRSGAPNSRVPAHPRERYNKRPEKAARSHESHPLHPPWYARRPRARRYSGSDRR